MKGVATAPHWCVFVDSWSGNKSSKDYSFLIGYTHVDCSFSFYWSIFTFAVTIGSCICHKIVVELGPVHPRKFSFKMAFAKVVKVVLKQLA